MTLDLSNEYARYAACDVAIFLPMFTLIKAFKVARYSEYQNRTGYWTVGLLLLGCTLFYAFALDYRARIIWGGSSLILLAMMLAVHFFNNR